MQAAVEDALLGLCGERVVVHGAGRTDTGVHALGQVASVTLAAPHPPDTLQRALNALLPPAVRVLDIVEADGTFHARFSAIGKTYEYRIVNAPFVSPFLHRYVWHVPGRLDVDAMREAAQVVSYEVPLGLCVVVPVLIAGTMDLTAIAEMQRGWFWNWLIFHDPFTFVTTVTTDKATYFGSEAITVTIGIVPQPTTVELQALDGTPTGSEVTLSSNQSHTFPFGIMTPGTYKAVTPYGESAQFTVAGNPIVFTSSPSQYQISPFGAVSVSWLNLPQGPPRWIAVAP